MTYDKRIWKTAAIAVVLTIFAGGLVMRLNDWAKGLNSGFIAYGQTGTGGTGGTSGTTTGYTQIIPQIAVGPLGGSGTYATFIVVTNNGTAAVTATATFYTAGIVSTQLAFATNNSSLPTFTGKTSAALTIPAGGSLTLSSTPLTAYTGGWGSITTSGAVNITAGFEVRDPTTSVLISRVGIGASPATMQKFAITRARNIQSGLDTGYAIVNTSSTASATITPTLIDSTGKTVATGPAITLTPQGQIAEFSVSRFFPNAASEPALTGTGYFTMVFSSSSPFVAATALVFEGAVDTSFPVTQLQ